MLELIVVVFDELLEELIGTLVEELKKYLVKDAWELVGVGDEGEVGDEGGVGDEGEVDDEGGVGDGGEVDNEEEAGVEEGQTPFTHDWHVVPQPPQFPVSVVILTQ